MQQAIVFMVSLREARAADGFESALRRQMQDAQSSEQGTDWQFQLYRSEAPASYLFVARFPEAEFERVSRANWPFVLLAIARLITHGMKPFASDIRCLSGGVHGLHELQEDWNERFGRFTKLSFDADVDADADGGSGAGQDHEHPTEAELAAMTFELRQWRAERFTDRASRHVIRLTPREGDTINQPFEVRLPAATA